MKVRCLNNTGHSLPATYFSIGYTRQSEFELVVGQTYSVYGMCLSRGVLEYLIDPQADAKPNWYPAVLFEVKDAGIPQSWRFSFNARNEEYGVPAIWGYEELVSSENHFDGLGERDVEALRIFFRRRVEMEAEADVADTPPSA